MSNREEALKQISEKIEQVQTILNECRKIAKKNKIMLVNPDACLEEDEVETEADKKYLKANLLSKILTQDEWEDIGMETYWMPSSARC